ncbi:RimK family alpha-L-glutamate ligase [Nocardia sp. NPDC051570]|uniref:RimK family alpha-L-glutamate ligase n=1 Tax=Nocardia sp. NPDC051570 TaxID=3364324 RepID=UPI0037B323F1
MGDVVVMTDFGSTEGSTAHLAHAVHLLTGRAPAVVDARRFYTGGTGHAALIGAPPALEIRYEGRRLRPEVIVVYEIPPQDRLRFARFQALIARSGTVCLGADATAWRRATDKRRTVIRFRETGVPHMESVLLQPYSPHVAEAFDRLGRDVWARPAVGFGGRGVVHITDERQLRAAAQRYAATGAPWLLSRDAGNFDEHGRRHQYRVVVLGDRVLRVCEHVQSDPDAPCNEAQGAISRTLPSEALPARLRALAVRATRALGLPFGGVDLVPERGGVVFEVNVHPVLDVPQGFRTVAVPFARAHFSIRPNDASAHRAQGRVSGACPEN